MPAGSNQVKIVTDSAADVPAEVAARLGITVVPLLVTVAGQTYRDGVDISGEEFYRKLKTTASVTTTSLPSLQSFEDVYRRLTGAGHDVVSIHISSKLSGTFNAALIATTSDGVTPEAVSVVDSKSVSMAQGWVAIRAAEAAQQGKSQVEVEALAQSLTEKARIYGALDSLEYVVKSGRVGRLPGKVGDALRVKPILTMLPSGDAVIVEKVRTRRRALERLAQLTAAAGTVNGLAVLHGADPEGAEELLSLLAAAGVSDATITGHIGAVLGTHLGPGAVGVCFLVD